MREAASLSRVATTAWGASQIAPSFDPELPLAGTNCRTTCLLLGTPPAPGVGQSWTWCPALRRGVRDNNRQYAGCSRWRKSSPFLEKRSRSLDARFIVVNETIQPTAKLPSSPKGMIMSAISLSHRIALRPGPSLTLSGITIASFWPHALANVASLPPGQPTMERHTRERPAITDEIGQSIVGPGSEQIG
jgi:hypothetical protein